MIWVVWRQHRTVLIASLTIIAVLTGVTLLATIVIQNSGATWEFGEICSRWNDVGACRPKTALSVTTLFALLLPLLLGIFVGVPTFARDIEQQTHVLGLTQSVSRVRWYLARVAFIFLPITLAMTCLGAALRLAATAGGNARDVRVNDPFHQISFSLYDFPYFETAGIAVGGYTLLSLLIASTAAILLRSTLGAMLTTFAVFIFVSVALMTVRENYATPQVQIEPINGLARASDYFASPYYTGDSRWVVGAGYTDAEGASLVSDESLCTPSELDRARLPDETDEEFSTRMQSRSDVRASEYDSCLRAQGVEHYEIQFHTEDDYWRFQLTEMGLLLLLSGATSLVGIWGVRRLSP